MFTNYKIIKTLKGFSGSTVLLMENDRQHKLIRKINNIDRNYERLKSLSACGFKVPTIYYKDNNILDMEYIDGLDIKTYIKVNGIEHLSDFLIGIIEKMASQSVAKDYTQIYYQKLSIVNFENLPFTKNELLLKLPNILPQSVYHGDMTLENLIYAKNNQFYLIDAATIEYDSWVFDIAKMRQDLHCGWFIRDNQDQHLMTYANMLQDRLLTRFRIANNDYLLILMLLRVFQHAKKDSSEYNFLLNEIQKLWK